MDEQRRRMVSVVAVLNIVVGACLIGAGLVSGASLRWLWVALGVLFLVLAIGNLLRVRRSAQAGYW
ncbi:hypothetical protein [Serinicoccus marinus]|uniref:hypothetical protein n=1 Tax=Serinicoccus marinus TaxID=247333 RepID=UPI0003B69745|nr:hypothetical protein [Serinicoccus marinus]